MAKRKRGGTTRKTTRRRRRSVGSVGDIQGQLTTAIMVLGGVAAAGIINKTVLANKSPMIKSLAPMALGLVVPMMIKSSLGQNIGLGLIAGGGMGLLKKFNLAGLGSDDDLLEVPLSVGSDGSFMLAGEVDDFDGSMSGTVTEALAGLFDED